MQCVSVCVLKCPVVRHRAGIDMKRGKRKRKQKKNKGDVHQTSTSHRKHASAHSGATVNKKGCWGHYSITVPTLHLC